MLGQENVTGKLRDKVTAVQRVHNGTFDFREMQSDASLKQPSINFLERLQRTQINSIHRWTHENHVGGVRLSSHFVENNFF